MRTFRVNTLISVAAGLAIACALAAPTMAQTAVVPAAAPQTAVDAALDMANMLDGAGGGISGSDLVSVLEDAAAAGQPAALWQLGLMYENGEGVQQDKVRAFGYFNKIAVEHADAAPKGVDSEIVAQSFVKVGEYYRDGLPEAGLKPNRTEYQRRVQHAATYFGNADAQYILGEMYTDDKALGDIPKLSYRWLTMAARKGQAQAQARLGDMVFNGDGVAANPEEGLMWLTVASRRVAGTSDEGWVGELLQNAMSVATPEQRKQGIDLADTLGPRFGGL
jgi:TPR repeat protein